jgi:hypothetical protein
MGAAINQVLETFSVDQLRDLAFAMSSRGVATPKAAMGRDALLELLATKSGDSQLALYAHRIEAVTPYKHLYLYSLANPGNDFRSLKGKIEAAYPNLVGGFREVDPKPGELEPQACIADDTQTRIYLKLVHQVEVSGWVLVNPKQKEFKQFRKRHPVVVTLRAPDGLITISFPGFSSGPGLQRDDRLQYSKIADTGVEFLQQKLGIECLQFQAKQAIDLLLQEEPDEVFDFKRVVRPLKGGRFAFDAGEESKVTTALTDFFRTEGKITVDEKQIRDLLRRSAASDIVLLWRKSDIVTRFALMAHGAEILFIWRTAGASSSLVDSILGKLLHYSKISAQPKVQAVRQEILSTPIGRVVQPAVVAQTHRMPIIQVVEILNAAVARGNFVPLFRVNTDALLSEFANSWKRNVAELPATVTDEHGSVINLSLPANIEVAFERVR